GREVLVCVRVHAAFEGCAKGAEGRGVACCHYRGGVECPVRAGWQDQNDCREGIPDQGARGPEARRPDLDPRVEVLERVRVHEEGVMMSAAGWPTAPELIALRDEFNWCRLDRLKSTDGFIGHAAHHGGVKPGQKPSGEH